MGCFRKVICTLLTILIVMQMVALTAACTASDSADELTVSAQTLPAASEETIPAETEETAAAQETEPAQTGETLAAEEPQAQTVPEETLPEETPAEAEPASDGIPVYFQTDYPDVRYGYGTIATSGCSITSLAMVATYLTGHTYMPDELAEYFAEFSGNNIQRLEYASDQLQLPWEKAENFHVALNALQEGKVVIALMNQKSIFTDGQHFIVLAGINENGKIIVHDPNEANYSLWNLKNAFAEGFETGDISCGYSGAWIYDPSAMPEDPFIYAEEQVSVEKRYGDLELTDAEMNLLASMVWVEAQGEAFEGQQAVAEVVLNRLYSGQFQSSVKGVIYADGQFRSAAYLDEATPTQTQYEAVERALNGPYVLPEDVVFFATYPVNENVWGQIGGHIFCYQW